MFHLQIARPIRFAAVFAVVSFLFHASAVAQKFCSEPVAPYCIDKDSEFDSTLQINRCMDDLKDYEDELAEYEKCISDQLGEIRSNLSAARQRIKEAEEKF